jgi:ATP-dependent HslUV protease ATP-binding subunit HslU
VFVPPSRDPLESDKDSAARQLFRKKLREGDLDNKEIEVDLSSQPPQVEIMGAPGMEEMSNQLQEMFQNFGSGKTKPHKLSVNAAFKQLTEEEAAKLINQDDIKAEAIERVEQHGIVFLDEIDKIVGRGSEGRGSGEVSREGVQRDLLPLVEGCSVSTKHGIVNTDHILFIASGAFALCKPSDLIPELQGRLPIRVELRALEVDDFIRILTEPNASLTEQYVALLATEGVKLSFDDSGIRRIAEVSWQVNDQTENIGARRLHTVMERLLETISYEASDKSGEQYVVDADYVDANLLELVKDQDLSRFIL